MTIKYLFDTQWIINAFQKQDEKAKTLILSLSEKSAIAISAISLTEIRTGLKGSQIEYAMPRIKNVFDVEDVNYEVAEYAGELLSKYRENGISLGDALIAATAIIKKYTLVSEDKNFKVIKELNLYSS